PGFRFMVSAGAMLLDRLGPPGFRFRFIDFRGPRFPFTSATPRARGRCWPGPWPVATGYSPTRGVAPKQHRGARACFHSGISGWFSLSLGAWVPKRIWRGEGGSGRPDLDLWFRPARCCSIGSGRPDLDLSISGPRASLLHQLHRVREGAAGQGRGPLLRGSSPTRGVAPKQPRGGSGVLSLRHFGLVLFIPWRVGAEENLARRRRLGPPGFRFMVSAGAMLLDRLGPPGFRFIDFRAPRFPFTSATPRARGRCWPGPWPVATG